jgi:hypothetical protein
MTRLVRAAASADADLIAGINSKNLSKIYSVKSTI